MLPNTVCKQLKWNLLNTTEHNFNAILKLIRDFSQAIELNESFILYLVLRFPHLTLFLSHSLARTRATHPHMH